MPFPEVERVIYKKNPLDQVVCQLRFPTILRIEAEIPASFQDRIRDDFPNFSEPSETKMDVPQEIKSQIPVEVIRHFSQSANKNYEFLSEDEKWKINLTRNFIALTCNEYQRWEKFIAMFEKPLDSFIEIYKPSFLTRIGLRYIDVIRRSVLNLNKTNWNELVQPYILGVLSSSDVIDNIRDFICRYEIMLADNESKVRIITRFVEHKEDNEICFIIDSDFFNNNKIEISKAKDKLNFFNKRATRLIQWCITEKLHNAMEPEKI